MFLPTAGLPDLDVTSRDTTGYKRDQTSEQVLTASGRTVQQLVFFYLFVVLDFLT